MKRVLAVLLIFLTLCGCDSTSSEMNKALKLRENMLNSQGCAFKAEITADYGETYYTFVMDCTADDAGNVDFTVVKPDSISEISGNLSEGEGKLTFDDQVLVFDTLADGQVTPVSAPWLLIHTLRSGYIRSCGKEGQGLYIQIDDSYEQDTLQVHIWTDHNDIPVRGEIFWQGRRIMTVDVENFTIV